MVKEYQIKKKNKLAKFAKLNANKCEFHYQLLNYYHNQLTKHTILKFIPCKGVFWLNQE